MEQSNQIWCGIDVAKKTFDAALVTNQSASELGKIPVASFSHDEDGVREFYRWLETYRQESGIPPKSTRVVMEATGSYSLRLYYFLVENDPSLAPSIVNPAKTSYHQKSLGMRNKTDALDARALGIYGRERNPPPHVPRTATAEKVNALFRLRKVLVDQRAANRLRKKDMADESVQRILDKVIKDLDQSVDEVLIDIKKLLNEDHEMGRVVALFQTIPGVGLITAIAMVTVAGDLRRFEDGRKLASFLGLAPQIRESGTSVRNKPRMSRAGNAMVRSYLYMAALAAKRNKKSCLSKAYNKLIENGKKGKVALVALMRKIAVMMRSMLIHGKPYQYPGTVSEQDQQASEKGDKTSVENMGNCVRKLRLEPKF